MTMDVDHMKIQAFKYISLYTEKENYEPYAEELCPQHFFT